MAPLQKRALYSLLIGLALATGATVFLLNQGDITTFFDDLNNRMVMYAAIVGIPLVYLVLVNITLRKPTQIDERDKQVMSKSWPIQWIVVIFTLVAWDIGLTEAYRDQGQMPIQFMNLIFMSILIISPIAQSLGIIVGYWSINRNG